MNKCIKCGKDRELYVVKERTKRRWIYFEPSMSIASCCPDRCDIDEKFYKIIRKYDREKDRL